MPSSPSAHRPPARLSRSRSSPDGRRRGKFGPAPSPTATTARVQQTVNRPLTCRPPGTGSHYLSVAEIVSLLEAVNDSRYAPLLRLLASTGLRRGETLALLGRRPDKRPSAGPWHALTGQRAPGVISEPKTERSRRDVPLSPATVALLRSVKASQAVERLKAASIWVETGLVFTTESGTEVDPGTHCGRSAPRPRLWA